MFSQSKFLQRRSFFDFDLEGRIKTAEEGDGVKATWKANKNNVRSLNVKIKKDGQTK